MKGYKPSSSSFFYACHLPPPISDLSDTYLLDYPFSSLEKGKLLSGALRCLFSSRCSGAVNSHSSKESNETT